MTEQISSKDKRIIVFSDPHQEVEKVKKILTKENYDQVVCLGDWFDSSDYNQETDWVKTCEFLKKWLFKPNFYTCIGNHDIQYFFGNKTTICSGYYPKKDKVITERFGSFFPAIREKFLWYLWIDDFLCSHAGVNTYHFPPTLKVNKKEVTDWLDVQIKFAEPPLFNGGYHWLYGAGAARGGRQNIGGITWQDFDSEFKPIEGLKQLVGHSSHRTILNHIDDGNVDLTQSENLDIDCHLNEYLLIHNGKLTIKRLQDL